LLFDRSGIPGRRNVMTGMEMGQELEMAT